MPGSLTEYALRLAQHPDELARFRSSHAAARAAMTDAGLTPAEQDLMLAGDGRAIGAALAAQSRDALGSDAAVAEAMEHETPEEEPMEHPSEPMEHPPLEPMEHPPEAMEYPPPAAAGAARLR